MVPRVLIWVVLATISCEAKRRQTPASVEPAVSASASVVSSSAVSPSAGQLAALPAAESPPVAPADMIAFPGGVVEGCTSAVTDEGDLVSPKRPCADVVEIRGYALDRTEVTTRQYAECIDAGKCTAPKLRPIEERWLCSWAKRAERADRPIDCVTRDQASAYCASKGKRLPTRHEWLRALRAQHAVPYLWSPGPEPKTGAVADLGTHAHRLALREELRVGPCWANDGACAVPAFPKDRSDQVSDLVGNVAEWTFTPGDAGQVLGLAWTDPGIDYPPLLQTDIVRAQKPSRGAVATGFRCARDGTP